MIRVCFREDNENEARAKNAEYRSGELLGVKYVKDIDLSLIHI